MHACSSRSTGLRDEYTHTNTTYMSSRQEHGITAYFINSFPFLSNTTPSPLALCEPPDPTLSNKTGWIPIPIPTRHSDGKMGITSLIIITIVIILIINTIEEGAYSIDETEERRTWRAPQQYITVDRFIPKSPVYYSTCA